MARPAEEPIRQSVTVGFTWQIAPDRAPEPNPAKASEVEVRFRSDGPASTRVDLEHRAFSRYAAGLP